MSSLKELLPLLAKADPSVCLHCEDIAGPGLPFLIRVDSLWLLLSPREMPTESAIPALVEYAVRQRVTQRRWEYRLMQAWDSTTVMAVVYTVPGTYPHIADEPDGAIAITTAYLKACGVEIGGGSEV